MFERPLPEAPAGCDPSWCTRVVCSVDEGGSKLSWQTRVGHFHLGEMGHLRGSSHFLVKR
jgi:hypothetical protein